MHNISGISPHYPVKDWISTLIGLRDQSKQSPHRFTWIDGTPYDYTNWATIWSYPSDDIDRNCVFIHSAHNIDYIEHNHNDYVPKWGNYPCDSEVSQICVCKRSPTSA